MKPCFGLMSFQYCLVDSKNWDEVFNAEHADLRGICYTILRLAMNVVFFANFAHPLRSLRLRIFTAKDAKGFAKYAKKK